MDDLGKLFGGPAAERILREQLDQIASSQRQIQKAIDQSAMASSQASKLFDSFKPATGIASIVEQYRKFENEGIRAAAQLAAVDGQTIRSWQQMADQSARLASVVSNLGVGQKAFDQVAKEASRLYRDSQASQYRGLFSSSAAQMIAANDSAASALADQAKAMIGLIPDALLQRRIPGLSALLTKDRDKVAHKRGKSVKPTTASERAAPKGKELQTVKDLFRELLQAQREMQKEEKASKKKDAGIQAQQLAIAKRTQFLSLLQTLFSVLAVLLAYATWQQGVAQAAAKAPTQQVEKSQQTGETKHKRSKKPHKAEKAPTKVSPGTFAKARAKSGRRSNTRSV